MDNETLENYPSKKVIGGFTVWNTVINSLLFAIPLFLVNEDKAITLLFVLGSLFSLLPSLLTGLVLSYNKITLHQKKDYFKVFLIGAGCLYALTTPVILFIGLQGMIGTVALSTIFGIASMMVAKFILPKGIT